MSREQAEYERDWSRCRRCHCRRPTKQLRAEAGALFCVDRGWCDRVVLWREEQAELAAEEAKKRKRRRGAQSRAAVDEED